MKKNTNKKIKEYSYVSDENSFLKNYFIIIKNNKMDFFLWVIMSIIVALIGIWFPCLIHLLMKTSEKYQFKDVPIYTNLMKGNPYILYSITFLAETVLSTISIKSVKNKDTTKQDKKVRWGVFVTLIILVMAGILAVSNIILVEINIWLQHLILIIAILIGLQLYPLKDNLYDPTVTSHNVEQDKDVEKLTTTSISQEDLLND